MKAIYFTKTNEQGPSSRYRAYQYLPYLDQAGIEHVVYPLFGKTYWRLLAIPTRIGRVLPMMAYVAVCFLRRAQQLLTITRTDLVVIEGQLFPYLPPIVEQVLANSGYKLVIEFDDAIYLTRFHQSKLPQLLRISTGNIVGNRALAEYARRHASIVHVVPTVVDTTRFAPPKLRRGNRNGRGMPPPTIVWIGLPYNFSYLNILIPALRRIKREFRAIFRVISSRPPVLTGIEVDFVPWDYETEVAHLQVCQIGVMPLPDNEWARGKCGLKLLQYMSMGMASVASPVGVNREIVRNGVNGFLASTQDEWYESLLRLCEDPLLRTRVGQEARKTVVEGYSLAVWAPRLIACYRSLSDTSQVQDKIATYPKTA